MVCRFRANFDISSDYQFDNDDDVDDEYSEFIDEPAASYHYDDDALLLQLDTDDCFNTTDSIRTCTFVR